MADQAAELVPFRADLYVICVEVNGVRRKVMQIGFSRGDGSMCVQFPYHRHANGLVSTATLGPGGTSLDLRPGGRVTSHRVKYSHHPDGRVHFSQDGRVYSWVRKQSVPLDAIEGHCFTAQAQGFEAFDALDRSECDAPPSARRTVLNFTFGDQVPEAAKFVGRIMRPERILRGAPPGQHGPTVSTEDRHGVVRDAFLLSAPSGRPAGDRTLLLTCEGIPMMGDSGEPLLIFLGGFDPPEVVTDASQPTSVLALQYPPRDLDELREQLGTIDLPPRRQA